MRLAGGSLRRAVVGRPAPSCRPVVFPAPCCWALPPRPDSPSRAKPAAPAAPACSFSGSLPEYWGRRLSFVSLTHLNLQDNALIGTLPKWNFRGAWGKLSTLNLQGNRFHGEGDVQGKGD